MLDADVVDMNSRMPTYHRVLVGSGCFAEGSWLSWEMAGERAINPVMQTLLGQGRGRVVGAGYSQEIPLVGRREGFLSWGFLRPCLLICIKAWF